MTDYWLSKFIYDLQKPGAIPEYRADRKTVIAALSAARARRGAGTLER